MTRLVLACAAVLLLACTAAAQDPVYELDPVVVTVSGEPEPAAETPRHVTVLTREDIEQSGAAHLTELLGRLPGVQVRPLFGTDKNAAVDLRGMGDTAPSTVVVMVDGVQLNAPDLLGADLSVIDLDSVERIEVLRGAAGVLYGDGAVGGVVNVITRNAGAAPRLSLSGRAGSYRSHQAVLYGAAGSMDAGGAVTARYADTDGYRDNGGLRRADVTAKADFAVADPLLLTLSAAAHGDRYGLPGPVSAEKAEDREQRRHSERPNDRGETADLRLAAAADLETGAGSWTLRTGLRRRAVNYVMGHTPLLDRAAQIDTIEHLSWELSAIHRRNLRLLDRDLRLTAGADYRFTDYVRQEQSRSNRENSRLHDGAVYALARWDLDPVQLRAGGRLHLRHGEFRTDTRKRFGNELFWLNGENENETWTNTAWELGAVWRADDSLSFFVDAATSFRTPNVDELARADDDLSPQTGVHLEAGARGVVSNFVDFSAAFFLIRIKDEIAYAEDPQSGQPLNLNFDEPTLRTGAELSLSADPAPWLSLSASYTWTRARFEDGSAAVPLVAEHTAGLGADLFPWENVTLSLDGRWVSERPDGNDLQGDRYDPLPAHAVLDARAAYAGDDWEIYAGVNNVTDTLYSSVAYSEREYPMPERNYYAGFSYAF